MPVIETRSFFLIVPDGWSGDEDNRGTIVLVFEGIESALVLDTSLAYLPLTHDVGKEKMQQFAGFLRHLQETHCCPLSARLYWVHGHRIVTLPWSPYGDDEATLLPSPGLKQILG